MGNRRYGLEQTRGKCRLFLRGEQGGTRMNRRQGFTLIELLVVIAIIAILAAITFPVFARAKASAYKNSDMSNMNSLRTALQLYRADQGAYPPALLGYATLYDGSRYMGTGNVVPANQLAGTLYPKRVDSLETLRPAYDRGQGGNVNTDVARAVWPNREGSGGAGQAGQRFGPTDGYVNSCVDGSVVDNYYYRISGYDAATVPVAGGGTRNELRYALFWTGWSVAANPCSPTTMESGGANDSPRQLGYTDPAEDTVITWNGFFRDYSSNGIPSRTKADIVLFLGGGAKPFDSVEIFNKSWAVKP